MRLPLDIGARIYLAAVLPICALAFFLTVVYSQAQLADFENAHLARAQALARQLAVASEYPIFSGNRRTLQHLAQSALSEQGVIAVHIRDVFHVPLVALQHPDFIDSNVDALREHPEVFSVREPILPVSLAVDDSYEPLPSPLSLDGSVHELGTIEVFLSTAPIKVRHRENLWKGLWVGILSLIFAAIPSIWLSRKVSATITQVATAVARIGQGHFNERLPVYATGSLRLLTSGVNSMANELADMHQDLNQRIEKATAEINARKNEAEAANAAKTRFLAAASHDLRQPMHALGLFLHQLKDHPLPPTSQQLVHKIYAASNSMAALLHSLLDISRLDAHTVIPTVRRFPIAELFDRLETAYAARAEECGVQLFLRHTDAWTLSDPILLERIIGNFISNAIRYAPNGRVLVACRRRHGRLRIEVRDNGIGIDAKDQELIFGEFVQLHNPERDHEKGLGLGLSIIKRLSLILDHPVAVRSALGKGSVFSCEVPDGHAQVENSRPLAERAPGDLIGLRVCLLDNDPLSRLSMESLLQSWGCEVYSAPSLDSLHQPLRLPPQPPDVVICDLRLTDTCNGIVAIERLRTLFGFAIPAALVTGNTDQETIALASSAEIPLMHKPVAPARLRAFLNRIYVIDPLTQGADKNEASIS